MYEYVMPKVFFKWLDSLDALQCTRRVVFIEMDTLTPNMKKMNIRGS